MSYDEYESIESTFDITQVKDKERQQYLKDLFAIERQIKELNRQKVNTLASLAEDGKSERIYDAMLKVHKGILESSPDDTLDDIIEVNLQDETEVKLLLDNKHSKFYSSAEIFDEFKHHPEQQALVKKKLLNKRNVKKSQTPNQHMTCVKDAKDIRNRFDKLEADILMLKSKLSTQEAKSAKLEQLVSSIDNKVDKLDQDISCSSISLANQIDDIRKLNAYLMYKEQGITVDVIAKTLGVTQRTIYRWISKLSDLGKQLT